MIGSQLNDEQTVITVEGVDMTVSQYIEGTFGFSQERVWYSALVLVGFCIAFWFVVAGAPSRTFVPIAPACTSLSGIAAVFSPVMAHAVLRVYTHQDWLAVGSLRFWSRKMSCSRASGMI